MLIDNNKVAGYRQAEKKRSSLSYPQTRPYINPYVQIYSGASVLKVSKGGYTKQVGGGIRKPITGFSHAARRRLLMMIGRVRRDAELPNFVTLTYHEFYPTARDSKRDIKVFLQRFVRRFDKAGAIWKLEPQERGAPHYHLLVWGVDQAELQEFTEENWHDIAGNNSPLHLQFLRGELPGSTPAVSPVRSFKGVWAYAAKYLGKTFDVNGWENVGRFWGVSNRGNIPFGEQIEFPVEEKTAVELMRYQKRFARMNKKMNWRSLTIYCDSDQWMRKAILPKIKSSADKIRNTGQPTPRKPPDPDFRD